MRFSVCIDSVFAGKTRDVAKEIRAVKESGADAFEFWSWWDKDLDAMKSAMAETGLPCALFLTRSGNLTDPSSRAEYREELGKAIEVSEALDCRMIVSQTGADTLAPRYAQHDSIIEGLKNCVPLLEKAGRTLVIEPLNTLVDHKGVYLSQAAEAFEITRAVGSPCVQVLYDIYHQQITEGNVLASMISNVEKIGHIHVAAVPGRHEPLKGELNYPFIFSELEKAGYKGYFGLEYFPLEDPVSGLKAVIEGMK
jgi:hydroxypyruvate isomerase